MYNIQTEQLEDTREGIPQLLSNINAWKNVSDYISTTLGPYGLDKMFITNGEILITNDGATILKQKKFSHPAARLLTSISENQDKVAGDGTTSVVVLASELLQKLKPLIKENFPLDVMVETLEIIKNFCIDELEKLKVDFNENLLYKIAETAINSKIIKLERDYFARMVVDGIKDEQKLRIKKVPGGSIKDSVLIQGVAFEKCFTYAGYEQQPKYFNNPKIACLNIELEWKAEGYTSEAKIAGVEEYQKMVDAEWKIITDKISKLVDLGANVVLSCQPIGDYATQYFAKYDIFCAGRVPKEDLEAIAEFTCTSVYSSIRNVKLGGCEKFEEKQVGKKRFNFLSGLGKASTLILRGPGDVALDEMERSVNDAILVVSKTLKSKSIVCGGGAVEMELSKQVKIKSTEFNNKQVFVGSYVAQALEIIPFTLALNFGLDSISVIQKLRKLHAGNYIFHGVDLDEGVADKRISNCYEPIEVKRNIIRAAFNAVMTLIKVDTTLINQKK